MTFLADIITAEPKLEVIKGTTVDAIPNTISKLAHCASWTKAV